MMFDSIRNSLIKLAGGIKSSKPKAWDNTNVRNNYELLTDDEIEKDSAFDEYTDLWPIRITRGMFAGTVYCYGRVRYEDEDNALNFEYHIFYGDLVGEYKDDFYEIAGRILLDMSGREDLPAGLA